MITKITFTPFLFNESRIEEIINNVFASLESDEYKKGNVDKLKDAKTKSQQKGSAKAKDFKGGNLGAQYLLEQDPDLQVIFANSDQVAAGVIQQLIKMKKRIPVIGQEDLDYSRLMDFSTVDHKLTEIGEYAFWSIFEKDVVKKMIPSELILRGSLKEK